MNDSSAQIYGADGARLANLLDPGAGGAWQPEELGAMFRHQMTTPVEFDLGGFDPAFARRIQLLAGAQGLLVKSFRDLFQHPRPPVALLEAVKDFAKRTASSREATLPKAIARMLYYLSIASALVRCDRRITKLNNTELLQGFRWATTQPWLDVEHRALLEEAAKRISAPQEDAS